MVPHPPPPPPHQGPPSHNQKGPHKKRSLKALLLGFFIGTVITGIIGGILWVSDIPVNVVLPVLAPVWVGSVSLFYSVLKDK
jgi:hypothetical protein